MKRSPAFVAALLACVATTQLNRAGAGERAAALASAPEDRRGNPLASIPLASLNATRDRPLFSPTRRPAGSEAPPPSVPETAVVAAPETPPFVLLGTILGGGADTAVLRSPATNAITRLRAGEAKDGWRAVKVGSRRIVLEKNGGAFTLDLLKPAPAALLPGNSEAPAVQLTEKGLAHHGRD